MTLKYGPLPSGWNTAKVTSMAQMFYGCKNLATITVGSGWNTVAVTSSNYMFYGCTSLTGYSNSNGNDVTNAHTGEGGYITIEGGTVTATGGMFGAGIGSGYYASCGDITIANTVTKVTATKGTSAPNSIGAGRGGSVGTVSITAASGKVVQN